MTRYDYTDKYNEAWRLWPGRWNIELHKRTKFGKRKGFIYWQKLSQEEKNDILALLKTHKIRDAGTKYLPDFFRWLRDGGFDDFL